jgi:general secretion pathway protein K
MRGAGQRERGAALLVVMVAVAVLTALAASLAYESRVSLRIAANARDELRASYQARSGVALSRLVLSFQQTVDERIPKTAGASIPRIQLWRLLPVGTELAANLFPAQAPPPAGDSAPESGFEADIDDEGRKVNAQLEALGEGGSGPKLAAQAQVLYQTICDPRWDPLFEREDALGVRTSREELLVRLRDWVDTGEGGATSALNSESASTSCGTTVLSPPFPNAYGDENQPYDRGDDRYRTKNARMDSLEELLLVAGVGDAFMAAFGDSLTVYLPRDAKWNVNDLDCRGIVQRAKVMAAPPNQARLYEPEFEELLCKLVTVQTAAGMTAMTPADFAQLVVAANVTVNMNLVQPSNVNSPFTDRSDTFRVRATGKAGAVTSAIDAVVRLEQPQPGAPVAAPGRLVHWREE